MKDIRQWTEKAVAGIRAADEREDARAELMAHYEDHRDALIERGMSKNRAEAERTCDSTVQGRTGLHADRS